MKFVGLDGLKHFWSKAKTWIAEQITAEVTAKIAEIVANAPEDLDTLKEIADWIKNHANDASAMNTAISTNTEAISGKADKIHTHTKSQITDFPTSLPANGGTADKAVDVVDYGNTSRTVKVGFASPSVTADKLAFLAGYTEDSGSSVKIKDVTKEEIIKWLGIPRIKYADYKTERFTFNSLTDQKGIELSNFGPDVTENNVLSFMVVYWIGVHIIAQGDCATSQGTGSTGLKCQLHALNTGTGYCVIRCVYLA